MKFITILIVLLIVIILYILLIYIKLIPFGWSNDSNDKTANNVRGYFFINERKKIIVISIKGTSAGLFGIGGPTADNDKFNVIK